jgi:hypothetical protein
LGEETYESHTVHEDGSTNISKGQIKHNGGTNGFPPTQAQYSSHTHGIKGVDKGMFFFHLDDTDIDPTLEKRGE